MYKGTITTSTTVTANTNIPFNPVKNTNSNTFPNDNTVSLIKPGYYRVIGLVNVTEVPVGPISLNLMDGNTALTETTSSATSVSTDSLYTLVINDILDVKSSPLGYATISLQLTENATVSNAILTIDKIK